MIVDPWAVQDHIPIWIGGRTGRSLRRAVSWPTAGCPSASRSTSSSAMLASVERPERLRRRARTRPGPRPERPAPPPVQDVIGRLAEIGATVVNVRLFGQSLDHYLEQLEALAVPA